MACQLQTKNPPTSVGGFFDTTFELLNEVWEQGHETRTLDGVGEFALMPLADAGTLARHDLPEGRKVSAKGIGIFVINHRRIHAAKVALFRFDWLFSHNWGSRGSERLIRKNRDERPW